MKRRVLIFSLSLLISFVFLSYAKQMLFYPVVDTELTYHIYDDTTTVQPDGQWWPNIFWRESPPDENQMVYEFDLSDLPAEEILYAELHFYIESIIAIDTLVLDTWFYEADGVISEADAHAGDDLIQTWTWESPTPGSEQIQIQQHVYLDATVQIKHRKTDLVGFNVRLAGDPDDTYQGNVFVEGYNEHLIQLAASEQGDIMVRPSLSVYFMPEQDTNAWQMKQKDMGNTGRAAYTIPQDRLNDTFFDDILWQTPVPGAFSGGITYFDGAGPDGADLAVCGNTWPNKVTGVDRHSGKLFWQESPGGGDRIGHYFQAFSNDGTTVYGVRDAVDGPCAAFSSILGPGTDHVNIRSNAANTDPSFLQMCSPTIAPDGRIFLHKWDRTCHAGFDNGIEIQHVWSAATEDMHACQADPALYADGDSLIAIQTGRGGKVAAFDANGGDQLWLVWIHENTDASPTIDPENGNIYFSSGRSDRLYISGLDIQGNYLWGVNRILLNDAQGDPNSIEYAFSTGCLSHDTRTYYFQSTGINVPCGKLYAINTADGSVRWTYPTQSLKDWDDLAPSPVVTQNRVIIIGNNASGQYLAIQDKNDHALLLDTFNIGSDKHVAKCSASISPDGKLYLPIRTEWTVGYEEGPLPNTEMKYCLTAFDLSGCDGYIQADLNQDCRVNLEDLAELAFSWMDCKRLPSSRCFE